LLKNSPPGRYLALPYLSRKRRLKECRFSGWQLGTRFYHLNKYLFVDQIVLNGYNLVMQSYFCILFMLSFLWSNQSLAECVWNIGWEPWEPYQYIDKNNKLVGIDVELIKTVASIAGCKTNYRKIMSWKRNLIELEKGNLDLAAGASKNVDRQKFAYFTEAYRHERYSLFVKKSNLKKYVFKNLNEILESDFTLGATVGYYYGEEFEKALKNPKYKNKIQIVISEEINMKKLIHGRIDGFPSEYFAGSAMIKRMNLSNQVSRHDFIFLDDDLYIMFSKKSRSLEDVKKFNRIMRQIKKNGTYDRILKKYR